jgi:hypothetical protein
VGLSASCACLSLHITKLLPRHHKTTQLELRPLRLRDTIPMFRIATAIILCIWASLQSSVDAHAALYQPVQRIHSGECAHCGGISQVSGNGGGPDAYPGTIMPLKGPCGEHQHNTPQKGVGYGPTDSYPVDGVIDVELYWNAPHGGWHSFRICPNETMNGWYTTPGFVPTQAEHVAMEACLNANTLKVLNDCDDLGHPPGKGWCHLQHGEGAPRYQVQLPPGFKCNHCLLTWRWDAWFSANELYNKCADIRVGEASPTTPPPTRPPTLPPPPTTAPPTPPPTPCAQRFESCGGVIQCCANNGVCQSNGVCQ